MRSWRPFCRGWPGWIRSMAMPRRSHQTASLLRPKMALRLAKGTPLSMRMAPGQTEVVEGAFEYGEGEDLLVGLEGVAAEQEAAGEVGDGQRFGSLASQLTLQEWWGNDDLALEFAVALGAQLGYPNSFLDPNDFAPYLAYSDPTGFFFGAVTTINGSQGIASIPANVESTFAVASRVAVPEPGTLALLGLGLAGLGFARRRKRS